MSQPSIPITDDVMRPSSAPIKDVDGDAHPLRKRLSQIFPKNVLRSSSPPPVPALSQNASQLSIVSATEDMSMDALPEAQSRRKLLKKRLKRFSAPVAPADRANCETIISIPSRLSLVDRPPRSTSNPLPTSTQNVPIARMPSTHTKSSKSSSSTAYYSSSVDSSTHSSTPTSLSKTSTAPSSFHHSPSHTQTIELYNPLHHYVPCLHPSCTIHYTPTTLGPTFHSPQPPYNLHRKRGLCHTHAYSDLRAANSECKRVYESMRQNCQRKTLGDIAREFEVWVKVFDAEREQESQVLARRLQKMVLGRIGSVGSRSKDKKRGMEAGGDVVDDYDWIYTPRPCTRQHCTSLPYSPFSTHNYKFYNEPRRSSLLPLPTLCPSCAKENLAAAVDSMKQKREERDDEEWVSWLGKLKRDREMETGFWEKAQERVVREKGVRWGKEENSGGKQGKEEELVDGKGVEALREFCVVM